jgi:protein-S-isoprenylcysteine O-methyltransferase Ste14
MEIAMKNTSTAATDSGGSERSRVMPPVYFLTTLVTMLALHLLWPIVTLFTAPVSYSGLVAILVGFVIVLIPARDFEQRATTIKPFEVSTVLITSGLYRFSRNPMYLGMLLVLLGVTVLLGTLSPVLPVPVFVYVLTTRFIRAEEAMLLDEFGEDYAAYCRKVRRWI